jgi:hypothetical protein
MAALSSIAAAVAAAAAAASAGVGLSQAIKGTPPRPKPPLPPAPAPPPPSAPPPFAPETPQEAPQAKAKRRREQGYGVEQTLLVSPVGGGQMPRPGTQTLLGG